MGEDQRNELVGFSERCAWPSSVRTVKRSVKSDNERDLISICNLFPGGAL